MKSNYNKLPDHLKAMIFDSLIESALESLKIVIFRILSANPSDSDFHEAEFLIYLSCLGFLCSESTEDSAQISEKINIIISDYLPCVLKNNDKQNYCFNECENVLYCLTSWTNVNEKRTQIKELIANGMQKALSDLNES